MTMAEVEGVATMLRERQAPARGDGFRSVGRRGGLRKRAGRQAPREPERQQRGERDRAEREPQRVELRVAVVGGDRLGLLRREAALLGGLLDGRDGHDVDPLLGVGDDRLRARPPACRGCW